MNHQSHYLRLGIFVLLAVAIATIAIIVLGVGAMFKTYVKMETYFVDSVQGLDVGAPITYRGVPVGKVSRIELATAEYGRKHLATTAPTTQDNEYAGSYILVGMDIDPAVLPEISAHSMREEFQNQAEKGMRVRISATLTGPPYLEVDYLDPENYPPLPISWKPKTIYIPSAPSARARIVSAVERVAIQLEQAHFDEMARHLDELLSNLNKQVNDLNISKISDQTSQLLESAKSATARVDEILKKPAINSSLENIEAVTKNARETLAGKDGNLQAIVTNMRSASEDIRQTTAQLQDAVAQKKIQGILTNLDSTTQNASVAMLQLRETLSRLEILIINQNYNIRATLASLRDTTANTAELTRDAQQNPARILFGAPPPRIKLGDTK